jgi:hypothetical protein
MRHLDRHCRSSTLPPTLQTRAARNADRAAQGLDLRAQAKLADPSREDGANQLDWTPNQFLGEVWVSERG